MTRTIFELPSAYTKWLRNRRRDYEVYYDGSRIYALPLVSTRPVVYGIFDSSQENYRDVLEEVRGIIDEDDIYPIRGLEFDEARAESSRSDEDG